MAAQAAEAVAHATLRASHADVRAGEMSEARPGMAEKIGQARIGEPPIQIGGWGAPQPFRR